MMFRYPPCLNEIGYIHVSKVCDQPINTFIQSASYFGSNQTETKVHSKS